MLRKILSQPTRQMWWILSRPVGQWRTNFLWRFFGLVIYQCAILLLHNTDTIEKFLSFPIGFHLVLGCGLLLILFGPCLLLLLLTSIAMFIFLIPWTQKVVERQVADEYILLMILPAMGVCLTLTILLQRVFQNPQNFEFDAVLHQEIDTTHTSLFRISIIIVMLFAVLHKLNVDFFDPKVSCASVLSKDLSLWWRFPFPSAVLNAKPYQIILGEGLIPILLVLYSRLGHYVYSLISRSDWSYWPNSIYNACVYDGLCVFSTCGWTNYQLSSRD